MKLYGPSIVVKANYTLWAQEDIENFSRTHDRLEELFNKRRVPGRGKLMVPYGWSGIVLHFVTMAIETDQYIAFDTIEERKGTLHVDFHCSHIIEENEVEDLLIAAKNRIDNLTHQRITRAVNMRVTDDAL